MDVFSTEDRSRIMAKVHGKNTKPELIVRGLLHGMGFRFRLHRKDLPGKPDIVLPKYQAAIFVHGCFWHAHDCRKGSKPTSNTDFWNEKLAKNVARDKANATKLKAQGWRCLTVWECQMKDTGKLAVRLTVFLKKLVKRAHTGGSRARTNR